MVFRVSGVVAIVCCVGGLGVRGRVGVVGGAVGVKEKWEVMRFGERKMDLMDGFRCVRVLLYAWISRVLRSFCPRGVRRLSGTEACGRCILDVRSFLSGKLWAYM